MKNVCTALISLLLYSILCAAPAGAQTNSSQSGASAGKSGASPSDSASGFKDDKEKVSYALGMRMALELKNLRRSIDYDPDVLMQGFKDALLGAKTKLTDDERVAILSQFQRDLIAKEAQIKQQMAETNRKEGEEFLAANKTKEGVVALPSGLQYKILTQGAGPKPKLNDTVVCNYRGTFINGKEFDSSYKHGQPATFPVIGVIRGWTEALQLMPVGSKWQLFIPASMAYGSEGHLRDIEPNATLIFEIELLSIKPQETGDNNQKDGEAFLTLNKAKEGVVALPSGLQYKVLTQGTGPKPTLNDSVVCHYKGTLIDGTEFDSSYKRGQPATFRVGGVIKGWTEALQLMPVGSKWQLFIPPGLAYGERGSAPGIAPNSTLIFEVELLSIHSPQQGASN